MGSLARYGHQPTPSTAYTTLEKIQEKPGMERDGWHPVGMYDKRRNRSATFCYTLITIALLAGMVAVVVSWLLATGIIDPDPVTNYKEGRRLDIFRDVNSLKADIKKVIKPLTNLNASESTISDIDKNKAFSIKNNENIDIDTLADIAKVENAILKKIESEVLVDSTITSTNKADPMDKNDDQTTETIEANNQNTDQALLETSTENIIVTQEVTEELLTTGITDKADSIVENNNETTEAIKITNESTNKAGPEATTENLVITQEVTEIVLTTITKDTKEDVTDSTEPYTVATIITPEAPQEEDKILTTVNIVDIIMGNLDTTTNSVVDIER